MRFVPPLFSSPHRAIAAAAAAASLLFAGAASAQSPAAAPSAPPPAPPTAPGAMPPPPPGPLMAPGAPPRPMAMDAAATQTVSGRVQQWIVNPNGEVDGLLLADGTQVAFPPHLSASLTQAVKLQETVQVTGWRAPGLPASAVVMRAQSIRSASGTTVADQPPGAGTPPVPPTPGAENALQAMNASGQITRVLYTDRGDANGVMLGSGSIVRFAPHIGAALADKLKPGASLYASGYGSRSAFGSALEATRIGSSADTAVDVFAGPAGPVGGPPRVR